MTKKLPRKTLPAGLTPDQFLYKGRPSTDQDDFGEEVGLADLVCVNQFGEANNNKYYHAGVCQSPDGAWWVYLEWGRVTGSRTWDPTFRGQDFQFVKCEDAADAREFFRRQCRAKNVQRLERRELNNQSIWVAKPGKDAYVVQRLATRLRGLPDVFRIRADAPPSTMDHKQAARTSRKRRSNVAVQPQVASLVQALIGGTTAYARAAQESTGIVPTMAAIAEVRDSLLPTALTLLARIGCNEQDQLRNRELRELSTYVASIIPRPIPRGGDPSKVILSQNNILAIQQDLDAFEAALRNESIDQNDAISTETVANALGREIEWLDPRSAQGRFVRSTFQQMTNNRHPDVPDAQVLNTFTVRSTPLHAAFVAKCQSLAALREGQQPVRAGLQPKRRTDSQELRSLYEAANLCLAFHGTRAVNVQPILASDLRLPKSLQGVRITGSAFGHGIYFATDWKKSFGYTGHASSRWVHGGEIRGRGFFMFLCDVALGKPFMARSTMWDTVLCPQGYDSIFAAAGRTSVANDEHVIFDPHQQEIRYLIEGAVC